eukprot:gnl/MRDRNA2_/MRDRNA2_91470_c0_seq1.p1 gnl/MRDRNA2_/MRDRNA2_91470_c0~~gnl/MRDRNA2_/MRDRNA2_91470_c0_seq1.p1  ORF type:complete len:857 (+),score=291.65 gnl/MRDRNA2_/MRDRNA2_91470_c0_seq1:70-2640(+)
MKLVSMLTLVIAACLPASSFAHYRRHDSKPEAPKPPPVKFDSMAANLQRAAAQSFLRHRVSIEEKELKSEKEQLSIANKEIVEMASRLDFEERRSSSLTARVNILEQNATAMVTKLQDQEQVVVANLQAQEQAALAKVQAQEQTTIDKLQTQVNILEQNAKTAHTEEAKTVQTQRHIPTVMHAKVPGKAKLDAQRSLAIKAEAQAMPSNESSLEKADMEFHAMKKDLMDAIKSAVATIPVPAKTQHAAPAGLDSVPSTWCPPPCDEHNASTPPEMDAKIDQVHAAMAIVSNTSDLNDLNDRVSQASKIMMKSAEDRANALFGSQAIANSAEITDQLETPLKYVRLSTKMTSDKDAVIASLSGSLSAARKADKMLNNTASLIPQNTTQGKTLKSDEELQEEEDAEKHFGGKLQEELDEMADDSLKGDSDEGLKEKVDEIVPAEDNGELTKMSATEQVDAADQVVEALHQQEHSNEDQKESQNLTSTDPEEEAASNMKNAIVAAAKEQGLNLANDSIVVLPTIDLDEPAPQNAQNEELKDAEQLQAIKTVDADAANHVNTAQAATEKLDQQIHETQEELKNVPQDAHSTEEVKPTSEQDSSVASNERPSEMQQIEDLAKAQVNTAKPTEEENKMVRDAIKYAETEPGRQQREDATMTKQQLQEAAAYARQDGKKEDQIDTIVKEASDADAGDSEDEEELDKLSQEGLVVDSDSADQPTVQEVAEVNDMTSRRRAFNDMPHDRLVQSDAEDHDASSKGTPAEQVTEVKNPEEQDAPLGGQPTVEEVTKVNKMPEEAAQSLKASAKGLVAAVAQEDAIAKEAQAAQQEDEQVNEEELDRMSHAGMAAANDLEAELTKIDH